MANESLTKAKEAKDDEFYTAYEDIKAELLHYAKYFKGKVIYCNCDDHNGIGVGTPKSNFLKYLADNFEAFGIKKVIATHYEKNKNSSTMYVLDKDNTGNNIACFEDISEIKMTGNGDFRSPECVELLKEADIVITNPPFSLFREYVSQLIEYKKKFLIIGNKNAITFKEFFPLLMQNKIWIGYNMVKTFRKPDGSNQQFGNVGWFTNLETAKRNEILNTGKKYYGYESMYPKYDNFDAIEVDEVKNIPMDYDGVMGVPITFMDRHNPNQFEIVGITKTWFGGAIKTYPKQIQVDKNGKKSEVTKLNDGATLELSEPLKNKTYYIADGKMYKQLYARVLIRKKGSSK